MQSSNNVNILRHKNMWQSEQEIKTDKERDRQRLNIFDCIDRQREQAKHIVNTFTHPMI